MYPRRIDPAGTGFSAAATCSATCSSVSPASEVAARSTVTCTVGRAWERLELTSWAPSSVAMASRTTASAWVSSSGLGAVMRTSMSEDIPMPPAAERRTSPTPVSSAN